jgi:glutaredoxin 3
MQTVKMYTTAVCPYCIRAKADAQGPRRRPDRRNPGRCSPDERQKMMDLTGRRTVPQIFIGTTHVGGCDDLMALDSRGGLMPLLKGG